MTGNDDFRMPDWDNDLREPDIFGEADEAVAGITEEAMEGRLRQIHRRADGSPGPAAMAKGPGTGQASGQVGENIWPDDGISDKDYRADSRDPGQASDAAGAAAAYEKLLDDHPYTLAIGGIPPGGPLTSRERDIAWLIGQGLTNKAIAAELVISPATVARHVASLITKLNLRSRAQIAVWVADTSHTRW